MNDAIDHSANTAPVSFTVLDVERVHARGKLLALVSFELVIAGVELTIQGARLERIGGKTVLDCPTFKRGDGAACPAVTLPPELLNAIAAELASDLRWRSGWWPVEPGNSPPPGQEPPPLGPSWPSLNRGACASAMLC